MQKYKQSSAFSFYIISRIRIVQCAVLKSAILWRVCGSTFMRLNQCLDDVYTVVWQYKHLEYVIIENNIGQTVDM